MKLSPALLLREIGKKYPVDIPFLPSDTPTLQRPYYPSDDSLPLAGRVRILNSIPALPPPEGGLFLVAEKAGYPVPDRTALVDAPSVGALFDLVLAIFERYDAWWDAVSHSHMQGQTIQDLLDQSLPFFKFPLFVVGADFTIIASAGIEQSLASRSLYSLSCSHHTAASLLRYSDAFDETESSKDVYRYISPEGEAYDALCVNIKQYGKTTYRLMMLSGADAQDTADGFLLKELSALIEHALLHNALVISQENHTVKSTLITALGDKTADYVAISQQLEAAGWLSSHEYLCIVFQLTYASHKSETITAICNYLENMISASCAFQQNTHMAVFINTTLSTMSISDISAQISFFVRDSLLKAGYSRILLGHFNLRRQYLQAKIALTTGSRLHPSFWIHRFNDIAFPYLLEQATQTLPGYMVSHERLLFLKNFDAKHGTMYYRTLQAYLTNHLNAVHAAKALFIHRSTFLHRLERIKEILNSNLTDSTENLYLMLSFYILQQEETGEQADH